MVAALAEADRAGTQGGARAELEPETELHAQMRGLAEVRPPDPCRRL